MSQGKCKPGKHISYQIGIFEIHKIIPPTQSAQVPKVSLDMLGKRKRETKAVSRHDHESEDADTTASATIGSNDVFRKYFEAQFAPLPKQPTHGTDNNDEDEEISSGDESDASEWSGISDSGEAVTVVEVIDHTSNSIDEEDEFHRARQKAFMSSKPPREITANAADQPAKKQEVHDPAERLNLKHDLDLQRLLRESHLLERSRVSSNPSKERQKALDLRLQALGAKESLFSQQKMPVSHRVGIVKKADSREARRRHDAKENGVILEKVSMSNNNNKQGTKKGIGRRERGVDTPGVGKFSGGTLKLSRKDVASIQGGPTAARRGRRR